MFNAYNKNDFLNFKVSIFDKIGTKLLAVFKDPLFKFYYATTKSHVS